jgi:hypothetical protein
MANNDNYFTVAITTGNRRFAECSQHSANFKKHSANALPSVILGKWLTVKKTNGKERFAECFLLGTRQNVCRVSSTRQRPPNGRNGDVRFAECRHSANTSTLPCAFSRHSTNGVQFAECIEWTQWRHSANNGWFVEYLP